MYRFIAQTIPGTKKRPNEDRIFINGHILADGEYSGAADTVIAAVCDGVGGEHGGDCAASIVVGDCLALNHENISSEGLIRHIINTNEDVHSVQDDYYYFGKMSTTVASLQIAADSVWYYNLGDTRIYKYAEGKLTILSVDHTLAAQMLRNGTIRSVDDASKAERNALTKYLGGRGSVSRPTIKHDDLKPEDTLFIICSDGIYKAFQNISDFQEILASKSDLQSKKEAVVQYALHNGSGDDKSIVMISKE